MIENSAARPSAAWFKRILFAFAALALVTLGFLAFIGFFGNFREVSPGKYYRSEQLKPQGFKDAITAHGIKSVLNLRGEQSNAEWYKGEVAVCASEKIDHMDINIGLGALPKPETLQRLVEKLEAGPYPMLVHCRSGSDRSGLAGAFYLNIVEKKPLAEAEADQVSWRFGHFAIGRAQSINAFFQLYHDTSKGQSLKEWLYQTYPAEYARMATAQTKSRTND